MRTETIEIFQFEELSEEAKQVAISWWRDSDPEYHHGSDNRNSMEEFAKIFPITVRDWSYGDRGEGVNFTFQETDEIEELTSHRLATYIWNHYGDRLFKGKYFGTLKNQGRVFHPRIRCKQCKKHKGDTGPQEYYYYNSYRSILLRETSCVLTGYYMDDCILAPMYKFLDAPDKTNFKELLEECFSAWIKACNEDVESCNSDEYITDTIIANEYEFTAEGKRY